MKPRYAKILALLFLLGTLPFTTGILFQLPALTWTGFGVIALGCFWFLAAFSAELRSAVLILRRVGKPRVVVVWSKWAADEYARLGWTLRPESTRPRNGAASYLLQWLREGEPLEVDWRTYPDFPFAVVHLTWAGKAQRSRPEHLDTEFYCSFEDWQERRMKSDYEFIRELQQKHKSQD